MTDRELHLTASYRCVDRCRAASCIQRVLSLSLRVCAQRARPRVVDLKSIGIEYGRAAQWMQGTCHRAGTRVRRMLCFPALVGCSTTCRPGGSAAATSLLSWAYWSMLERGSPARQAAAASSAARPGKLLPARNGLQPCAAVGSSVAIRGRSALAALICCAEAATWAIQGPSASPRGGCGLLRPSRRVCGRRAFGFGA